MSQPIIPHSTDPVLLYDSNHDALLLRGATVPSNAPVGYASGCIFLHTDGSGLSDVLYVNTGTAASANFDPVHPVAAAAAMTTQLTTLTPADAEGTPDYAIAAVINSNAYGFASAQEAITVLYVIKNLQTRLAEVEAILEGAGLVTAN